MHKKFNVKANGDVPRIERVEVTENKDELTIDQIESMVDDAISKERRANKMLEQAQAEKKELKQLLNKAVSNTKDKELKSRFKKAKNDLG